ncbi:Rossmann-fold NAD(P)-binding domain-containing protein [Teichococcus oryzae]|uniref:SDR family NAD(P)-dependent oxidoreductase n=1 Tax=Teichococcus oryzae TaxID=1608942 RepID=A0A5B2TIR6_9PROT|nr:SDR family NAD(P)-dependent oxidoreductase [Pseudoroseomonas oryzae]KAA2214376.1 SDR family NAD(P)-dependent oxidoreductase [Pseudoroseomonas oryzae]
MNRLVVMGLGYSGSCVASMAREAGFAVQGTRRDPPPGSEALRFAEAGPALAQATHLLVTAAPEASGDPVLAAHAEALRRAPALRWVGYISTTAVYGDRGGEWVTETSVPAPRQERAIRRLRAEEEWQAALAGREVALDLFRTGGIYGPGRSALDDLRAGRARRVDKPGHLFSRIHRDDIAGAVLAAMRAPGPPGRPRVLHLVDDEPASGAAVVEEAARLLGVAPPPLLPFAQAVEGMSPMGRSFWAESRRVSSEATRRVLELRWRHPSYREGLRAILAAEATQHGAEGR